MKRLPFVAVAALALACEVPPTPPPPDDPPLELEPIAPIDIPPPIECAGPRPVAALALIDAPDVVHVFDTVRFDTTGSLGSDGGPFLGEFEFTLLDRPATSTASLYAVDSPVVELEIDAVGRYVVQLQVYEVHDNFRVRSCEPAVVVVDAEADGDLVALLTWDHPSADLDLHTLREGGQPFTHEGDVYFSNRDPEGEPWSDNPDENPELNRDDNEGFGPEMTTVRSAVVGDAWTFAVHYWSSQSDGDAFTTARLRVYARGEPVFDEPITFETEQVFWNGVEVRWTNDAPLVTLIDSLVDFPRPF